MVPAGSALGAAAAQPAVRRDDRSAGAPDRPDRRKGVTGRFDCSISDYSAPAGIQRPDDNDTVTAPAAAYTLLRADHTS